MKSKILFLILGFVLGVCLTLVVVRYFSPQQKKISYSNPSKPPDLNASPRLPEPDFSTTRSIYEADWFVTSLEGETTDISQFKGRILFVSFWATWCQPCVNELPQIQALYDSLQSDNVAFLLLTKERPDTVKSFIAKHGFRVPVYTYDRLPMPFKWEFLPMTYILDQNGRLVYTHNDGAANWNHPSVYAFINQLGSRK